jgi:hypothetical protein
MLYIILIAATGYLRASILIFLLSTSVSHFTSLAYTFTLMMEAVGFPKGY